MVDLVGSDCIWYAVLVKESFEGSNNAAKLTTQASVILFHSLIDARGECT